MLKNSLLAALVKLGCHCYLSTVVIIVKKNQETSFAKKDTESGWPFISFKLANHVIATCLFIHVWNHYLTVSAVSSSGVVVTRTLEKILFIELGLALTEINIKIV